MLTIYRASLGTLQNYDGDGKENVTKAIGLMTWNDQILSLLEDEHGKTLNSTFSIWISGSVPSLQLQPKFPSFK